MLLLCRRASTIRIRMGKTERLRPQAAESDGAKTGEGESDPKEMKD